MVNLTEALILLTPNGGKRLLGLSLLNRLLLYARRAELKKCWLYSEDNNLSAEALKEVASDRRLSRAEIELRVLRLDLLTEQDDWKKSDDYVLVLEDSLVVHPEFFKVLTSAVCQAKGDIILITLSGSPADRANSCPGVFLLRKSQIPWLLAVLKTGLSYFEVIRNSEAAEIIQISAPFCIRVDLEPSFRKAEKLLLETGRKPIDGYITRVFFRPISLRLTKHLIKWGLTPNQISIFVLLLEFISVYLIVKGGYKSMALGALLFELASVVDCCDGENARLTCRITRFGTIFDVSADAFLFVTFFTALPIGVYRTYHDPIFLYLGVFGLLSMVGFYLQLIRYARRAGIGFNIIPIAREVEQSSQEPDFQSWFDRLASKIAFIYRRDFFTTAAFILIALGGASLLVGMVSFFAFLEAVYFGSWARRRLRRKVLDKLQTA